MRFTRRLARIINPRREFFDIEPEQAIALELMALEDMTPALQEANQVDVEARAGADKLKRSRRPPLNFGDGYSS